ncbi:MAG: tRNA lysidine(34) synthetase TilS [Elusimicrobia bacterium]|nr:tRNA lysidine(34) synthetase TilS [Elusimicrobiota bacterium]
MFQKIKRFIDKYELIKKNDRLLVALSGGPDSVFLLTTLVRFRNLYKIKIFACHIDHQYRKKSYKDAEFVKAFCKNLKIPVKVKKIKLDKFTEENARNLRYKIFKKCMVEFKCNKVATGHTMDDNAETVLMWLVRGCGLNGLKGIPPRRTEIIRPILNVAKKEILKYLRKNNIKYCVDRTNFTSKFTRNRVRMEIIPILEKLNPRAKQHIFEFSEKIRRNRVKSRRDIYGVDTSDKKYYNKKLTYSLPKERMAVFDADKLDIRKLKIRRWKTGDKMVPFGMTGSKKLQDIFTDEKVPGNIRAKIPIVTAAGKIIWVAGIKRSNDAPITNITKDILQIELPNE